MKKTDSKKEELQISGANAIKGGSYSLVLTALVLAIVIVINTFFSALPKSVTKFDISSSKLYSITSNTKVVVNSLDKAVTIYWIVQAGEEDEVIENLLSNYDSLSDHIEVVKKNPDIYPAFAQQYTNKSVQNNSLVVECGDRYRYIGVDEMYVAEADMYSYSYNSSFDGEGAITSAIDYVVSDELPVIYLLEGHGEAELPSTFANQLEKENIQTQSLSLLSLGDVPEDAAGVIIHAPASDISEEEQRILSSYVSNGGKLLVMAGPVEDSELKNLNTIVESYGVQFADGFVIEGDSYYHLSQMPYMLIPDIASHAITDSLIEENYYAIMPLAQGMTVDSSAEGTVTELLTTSYYSFGKTAGYALTTYDFEDGDTEGPFAVAVSVEDNSGGQIVWFSSADFLADMYNAYSSGANGDMVMNAIASLIGESEAMAIRSKSLNYNYLTISDSTASLLKTLMIFVFPLAYLGIGVFVILRRRRKQNEAY